MLSTLKDKKIYTCIIKMSRRITTAIYGKYDPDTSDKTLLKLQHEYRCSIVFKRINEEEEKYLLEKWYFMRKFFEAENLCEDILRINDEFRLSWIKQKRKDYYDKNAEKIREQKWLDYHRNREKHLEYGRTYREKHPEQVKEKIKQYTKTHREQINEKKREKVTCECGAIVTKGYLSEHKKSIKHKENIPKL